MEASPKYPRQSTYEHSTLPEPVQQEAPLYDKRSWTRWPFLLLLGILIALIAGLAGGFIGKAIEGNKHTSSSSNSSSDEASAYSSSANSSTPTSSSSASPAPTTESQLVIPQTGCPDTTGRTFQSTFSNTTYKLFCNVNWIGSDLAAIHATSLSDCVEACKTVNQYGGIDKSCIGATFVPDWVNTTLAVQKVNRTGNCFL
ncbi:Nn.00g068410.m01.CDS01 [Neocucurbitaria sp. VM-36]